MKRMFTILLLMAGFQPIYSYSKTPIKTFETKNKTLELVELFTSEGCSSCPPAERKFARLREDKNLWETFVPISFHVDYWNDLGWIDVFSNKQFTQRQRAYARSFNQKSVYTPNFIVNGREWRPWRMSQPFPIKTKKFSGTLKVEVFKDLKVTVKFWPTNTKQKKWKVEASLLQSGIRSKVKAGENSGRTLRHEFIALNLKRQLGSLKKDMVQFSLDLSKYKKDSRFSKQKSIAVWVMPEKSLTPVQAIGGEIF